MKRIEFIAPVEAMRGNLSGKQELEYPLNDNPAYDAPAGKHYATNYQPRFIGAKRASDNLKYFAVRTKSAINKTIKSILAMAALGAAGAIIGAIMADKTSALYIALQNAYATTKPMKDGKAMTFRKWLSDAYFQQLKAKTAVLIRTYSNNGVPAFIAINNPFVSGGTAQYNVTISNNVLVKFWSVLANNPVIFTVDGQKGIAHSDDLFRNIIGSHYNVLDLSIQQEGEDVMLGDMYVVSENVGGTPNQVIGTDPINADVNYVYFTQETEGGRG